MAGSNISSPQGGYSGFSENYNSSSDGYQRSQSVNGGNGAHDWGWTDEKSATPSYQNSGNDDWNGFDTSYHISTGYQQHSSVSQNNGSNDIRTESKSQSKKTMKLPNTNTENLESLDVKTAKAKTATATKTNKLEDDAWNLLNDWNEKTITAICV